MRNIFQFAFLEIFIVSQRESGREREIERERVRSVRELAAMLLGEGERLNRHDVVFPKTNADGVLQFDSGFARAGDFLNAQLSAGHAHYEPNNLVYKLTGFILRPIHR